ncbi:MucB/RseB C-terminal domain-containing protein [Dokdonella sp.]|uniref:MucB/RseB C-terminal domain-containing protein n=1 Tax=Dokdonella sp. TaxID=2291710 RepID=UPI00352845D5
MHPISLERAGVCLRVLRSVWKFGASLVLSAACAGPGFARQPDAQALLAEMATAIQSLDYQGSFLYQHAGQIDTLRVVHAGGSRERERLVSLNGPRTEIIRNGPDVTFVQPDGSALIYPSNSGRGLLPLVPGTGARSLEANYRLTIVGTDRVAGYDADVVDVEARDSWRYGYRLWLDRNSRLLLRSMVLDSERRILEQFMFVALQIGPLPDETELIPSQRELLTTRSAQADDWVLQRKSEWVVTQPPPGFTFSSVRRSRQLAADAVEHLVYSDGLANISIYLEPSQGEILESATLNERGPLNILAVTRNEWRITAVGDVPATTLSAIVGSLRRDATPPPGDE